MLLSQLLITALEQEVFNVLQWGLLTNYAILKTFLHHLFFNRHTHLQSILAIFSLNTFTQRLPPLAFTAYLPLNLMSSL